MKSLFRLTLTLLCALTVSTAFAQYSPHQLAAILNEKVRDPQVRAELFKQLHWPVAFEQETQRAVDVEEGAEPSIAIDPNDPSHIAIAFMDPSLEFPIYWSNDGGFTWTQSSFDCLATSQSVFPGDLLGGGDPVLEFTPDGKLHLTWIYLLGSFAAADFTVYYAVSDDFGATFQASEEAGLVVHSGDLVDFDLIDRQWLAADHTDGPYSGNLYMSGAYFGDSITTFGEIVMVKTPTDDGFGNATTAYTGGGTQYGNVEVDGVGNVHLSLFAFTNLDDQTEGEVVHCVSSDGATTWQCTSVAPESSHPANGGANDVHGRENPAVSMAADGSYVYMTWTSFPDTGVEAYFAYSHDNGANWSVPTLFGPEQLGEGFQHFMPVVSADNGKVTVSWFGIADDTDEAHYYAVESLDQGLTFGEVLQVSAGPTVFTGTSVETFYGDYNSAVKYGCDSYHAWSDGNEGGPVVYVVKYNGCDNTVGLLDISPVNASWGIGALYPNPANASIKVDITGAAEGLTYRITSAQGRVALSGKVGPTQVEFDVSELGAGVYVLQLIDGGGVGAQRTFVKR